MNCTVDNFSRIYSWRVFDRAKGAWVELRRSEMHGPGMWHTQARTQDGRVLATRVIDSAYAEDAFQRYGAGAEITYYS